MFDEPFAQGNTWLHRRDPRVRLLTAAVCAFALASLREPQTALAGLVLAAALAASLRPPLEALLRRFAVVNLFVLFLWLTVPLTMPGDPVIALGPLWASRQGIDLALLVTLKSNAIFLVFVALVASMPSPTLGYALERLRTPSKLVFLFLFTYRYLHVIFEEWQALRTAAQVRGFAPRTNMHTYRTIGYMLGMVFVRSYERSLRVLEAMRLRGFNGAFRTVTQFRATPVDVIVGVVLTACALVLAASERHSLTLPGIF